VILTNWRKFLYKYRNKTADLPQMADGSDVITQQNGKRLGLRGLTPNKGPLLRSLLAVVGAKSNTLFVQALNDYKL